MLIDLSFLHLKIKKTKELLKEIHEYITWQAPLDIQFLSGEDIHKMNCEVMRVTVRLTRILGWLMLQKSILDGKYSRTDLLAEKLQLLQGKACLDRASEKDFELPSRLRELLIKSRILYIQTKRLEKMSFLNRPSAQKIKKSLQKRGSLPLICLKKKRVDSV